MIAPLHQRIAPGPQLGFVSRQQQIFFLQKLGMIGNPHRLKNVRHSGDGIAAAV